MNVCLGGEFFRVVVHSESHRAYAFIKDLKKCIYGAEIVKISSSNFPDTSLILGFVRLAVVLEEIPSTGGGVRYYLRALSLTRCCIPGMVWRACQEAFPHDLIAVRFHTHSEHPLTHIPSVVGWR